MTIPFGGSYQGQNLVRFDNMTLFSISSFDDNQSVIHPLMIKEIDIQKGGFDAETANCVGGLVTITGKNGDTKNLQANINLNNQAVSGYLNIPIEDHFSLQTAYRQTFYNILDFDIEFNNRNPNIKYYTPDYVFRDFNAKLSGKFNETDNFYLSFMASDDNFDYQYTITDRGKYFVQNSQQRLQYGTSLFYNKHFPSGSFAHFVLAYSQLNYKANHLTTFTNPKSPAENSFETSTTTDQINDLTVKLTYVFPAKLWSQLSLGAEFRQNNTDYQEDVSGFAKRTKNKSANQIGIFLKDEISLFGKIQIQPSFRIDFPLNIQQFYFQPRIHTTYHFAQNWKFNMAYGIYHQFMTKNTIIDHSKTSLYTWDIANNNQIPILTAKHYIAGITWDNSIFKLSLEGFYKNIDNLSIFEININRKFQRGIGKAKIRGLDVYAKTEIGKHEVWLAYTLSETLEYFPYFQNTDFQLSPHHQAHELKGATVFHFSPFYISTNYVYGSGLEFAKAEQRPILASSELPTRYSRLDVAVLYRLKFTKVKLDFGASIINVLNTQNLKYVNRINLPNNELVYSKSLPFTPMINLRANW